MTPISGRYVTYDHCVVVWLNGETGNSSIRNTNDQSPTLSRCYFIVLLLRLTVIITTLSVQLETHKAKNGKLRQDIELLNVTTLTYLIYSLSACCGYCNCEMRGG